MTLKQILEEHPEYEDLPVAVIRTDGQLDYIGASGSVILMDDEEGPVVVFVPN